MLKKIPPIISPDLMKVLMEMGHGDEICLADGNFPSESMGKRVVRLDGHGIEEILEAILAFFPLDTFADNSVFLMQTVSEAEPVPQIWSSYRNIIESSEEKAVFDDFGMIERFEFYERAKKCYAVVATGESALYANIVLKKGVVKL
jgi:L-fucose mutarotase